MSNPIYTILFLCTGNSARSILAESLVNHTYANRLKAYSAGSYPKGDVNPAAFRLLDRLGHDTSALRSKSWDEFAGANAPAINFIFTVCDAAAGETCPYWPGKPVTAHWGIPDPAAVTGNDADIALAFADAYRMLNTRIALFAALPLENIEPMSLQNRLEDIGKTKDVSVGG